MHHGNFHGSQSMHHDHFGKNLSKIPNASHVDSYGTPAIGANGRPGAILMHSTTPPPMMIGDSQPFGNNFGMRGMVAGGPQVTGHHHELYHAHSQAGHWGFYGNNQPNGYGNGYF